MVEKVIKAPIFHTGEREEVSSDIELNNMYFTVNFTLRMRRSWRSCKDDDLNSWPCRPYSTFSYPANLCPARNSSKMRYQRASWLVDIVWILTQAFLQSFPHKPCSIDDTVKHIFYYSVLNLLASKAGHNRQLFDMVDNDFIDRHCR